jgi:hypothetical protein
VPVVLVHTTQHQCTQNSVGAPSPYTLPRPIAVDMRGLAQAVRKEGVTKYHLPDMEFVMHLEQGNLHDWLATKVGKRRVHSTAQETHTSCVATSCIGSSVA